MSDCIPQRELIVIHDWRREPELQRFQRLAVHRVCEDGVLVGNNRGAAHNIAKQDVYYGLKEYNMQMFPDDAPRILLCYLHRPVCVGMQLKAGFRMVGCDVRSAGPASPHSWSRPCHAADYEPPDYELADGPCDVNHALAVSAAENWRPQIVMMVDQWDDFYLVGETAAAKFVYLAVENWDEGQRIRSTQRRTDLEFYCVRHWQDVQVDSESITVVDRPGQSPELAPNAQRFLFAVDVCSRPYLRLPREKWVCQIGVAYEPRYRIWNRLRQDLDRQVPLGADEWNALLGVAETTHTIFGWARRHREAAAIYNRSMTTISSSNVDYVPNRVPDAFATGAILLSDDIPTLRAAFGVPYPENPHGIWMAHTRTSESIIERVRWLVEHPDIQEQIRLRALLTVAAGHTYAHRAYEILRALEIEPVMRLM